MLALNYAGGRLCLTPGVTHEDPDVLGYYDYYHSLVASAVLWAAQREPAVRIRLADKPGEVIVHASEAVPGRKAGTDGPRSGGFRLRVEQTLDLPQGESRHFLPLPGPATGPRLVSVWAKQDGKTLGWVTGHVDLGADAPHIAALKLEKAVAASGGTLAGTVELSAGVSDARVDLMVTDTLGRQLVRQMVVPNGTQAAFQLQLPQTATLLHEIRAGFTRATGCRISALARSACRTEPQTIFTSWSGVMARIRPSGTTSIASWPAAGSIGSTTRA